MMVRRAALDAVGPLDEAYFMHCEDLDWCMRFRQSGRRVLFVPTRPPCTTRARAAAGARCGCCGTCTAGWCATTGSSSAASTRRPFLWLVVAGVAVRFSALASIAMARTAGRRILAR